MGTPTTNHTSRAPNRNTRAAESQFTFGLTEKTSRKAAPRRPRGRPEGMPIATASRISASMAAMPSTAGTKPTVARSPAPTRKPKPFTAFLDPVSMATQRKSPPRAAGASPFTALLALILLRSLATPEAPWTAMT